MARRIARGLLAWVLLAGGCLTFAEGGELGFTEEFALATDRAAVLQKLIPGSEDHFYYSCLHLQQTQQFEQAAKLIDLYVQQHGRTPRALEIQLRQALLTYDRNPQQSAELIRQHLGIEFNHRRREAGEKPQLPTRLAPDLIDRARILRELLAQQPTLDGCEDAALDWLVGQPLSPELRRQLLQRIQRPDYANLVELIHQDLGSPGSGGFGSLPIHQTLLLSQLDALLKLRPALVNQKQFVQTYLLRLVPSSDSPWHLDPRERLDYLTRVWSFVERLPIAHRSLQAHVLYHRLFEERRQGQYDKDRFLTYLKLPRQTGYLARGFQEQLERQGGIADLNADFRPSTGFMAVGNDEPLVRDFLTHFFREETTTQPYEELIDDGYLRRLFAEVKLVHGLGDPSQWYPLLPPEQHQALRDRVDLEFDIRNRERFAADDIVTLDVHVKNVPRLLVKVFEINAENAYRQSLREVGLDVNLDGLVANESETHEYQDAPIRRVARHFEFPQLKRPGIYVIDFIGNGVTSRAVVRKGQLRQLERITDAGHVFEVLDEQDRLVPDARLWLSGHEFTADDQGKITVPFSEQPGVRTAVLSSTQLGISSLTTFVHLAESYSLAAGLIVDRESLVAGKSAQVLIRPMLTVAGHAVPIALLEEPRLVIQSVDLSGVTATKEVAELPLHDDRESTVDFQVPRRLTRLTLTLSGQVRQLSTNKKIPLVVTRDYALNSIDQSQHIEDLHLSWNDGAFAIDLLGKSGEPKPDRVVRLSLKHRQFKKTVDVELQTDVQGRVDLGPLADVEVISATGQDGITHTWNLVRDRHSGRAEFHARSGETVVIPVMFSALSREQVSLLEFRGGQFREDHFDKLALDAGLLTAKGLPAGDFDLWLKRSNEHITVRVAAGEVHGNAIVGPTRQLQKSDSLPLQIGAIELREDKLVVKLHHQDANTRIHLLATRYWPGYDPFSQSKRPWNSLGYQARGVPVTRYAAGRQIGDEMRYIFDRRLAPKFPGMMLDRPGLLLNPWAIRSTDTRVQNAAAGEAVPSEAPAAPAATAPKPAMVEDPSSRTVPLETSLDFLTEGATVLANLVPNEQGFVEVPRGVLLDHQHIRILAIGGEDVVERHLSVAATPLRARDLRLTAGLLPDKHFTQQQRITVVSPNESLVLRDAATAKFEVYDSLARVFGLYASLQSDPRLREFAFLLQWPKYTPEQKREWYSKYACHEVHFFLYHKDPAFFAEVIKPFLANKYEPAFMDLWLLDAPLDAALDPWNYEQLNVLERILLSRRIEADRDHGRRHVRELLDLVPPDLSRVSQLYRSTLQAGSLERGTERFALEAADATVLFAQSEVGSVQLTDKLESLHEEKKLQEESVEQGGSAGANRREFRVRAMDRAKASAERLWMAKRKSQAFFLAIDQTREWAETQYFQVPLEDSPADRVRVNAFWKDYANFQATDKKPFLSREFAAASGNLTEILCALAVLDLPFESGKLETKLEGPQLTVTSSSPFIAVHEEILGTTERETESPLQITENFFQANDRYRQVNNEQRDKFVADEFLIHTVYGGQIVVTNPSSAPQQFEFLRQVPVGAVALQGGEPTVGQTLELKPFSTQMLEYYFYFPAAGDYVHYPAHVAKGERWIASAATLKFHVVKEPTRVDRDSWEFVSQQATEEEVLKYLSENNVLRLDLEKIAFRLAERAFFDRVISLLRSRHAYQATLWSYGLKHLEPRVIREYLEHSPEFVAACGDYLQSPVLVIDPVERRQYQHLEYYPLVNARAHMLGTTRQILNDRFAEQYERLLKVLGYKRELDDHDRIALTYYLLLQDRVAEAAKFFEQVRADRLPTRMQYDYCTAYLALCREDLDAAQAIAKRYADYPITRWRQLFATMASQIAEARGAATSVVNPENRDQTQGQLAASQPTCELVASSRQLTIRYRNLPRVSVNFYLMDVEVLFSRNPFGTSQENPFGWVRPNHSLKVDLPPNQNSVVVDVPKQFQQANVLVEVTGPGITTSQPLYANALAMEWSDNYGQVQVRAAEGNRPLSKVYVKVYARMKDGTIQFHKDGYTDFRGRFDYATISTSGLDSVDRLSILVLSEEFGSTVREVSPPQR